MTPKEVYIPVPVDERLPEKTGFYLTIECGTLKYFPKEKKWFYDGREFHPATWLEKKEDVFVLTKEELEKVYKAGEDSKENEINGDGETDFNDWLNTQKP